MTTPVAELENVIVLIERSNADPQLNAAQKAGELLRLAPRLMKASKAMLEYHFGYSSEHRRISTLVSKLLEAITPDKDGTAAWVSQLPPGAIPTNVRRALIDVLVHFKRVPP